MDASDLQPLSDGEDSSPLLSGDEAEEEGCIDDLGRGGEKCRESGDQQSILGFRHRMRSRAVVIKSKVVAALRGWIKQELIALFKLTVPVFLTLLFHNLLFFVALLCVGNVTGSALELDSVALAFTFVNVTGVSIGIGLATACDTLCAQAFGFKNYKRVGIVLQRGILILTIAVFPIWALWLNTESFLLLLQQKPCVARLTGQYVRIYCIALPFIYLYFLLQQYLQAQGIVWMFVGVGIITNIINAILCGTLIFWAKLGVHGAAISLLTANIASPLLAIAYTRLRNLHRQTWGGWTWESLKEWGLFTKLGVPGLFMICFEWWAIEVATFVAGSISETQLAINSILLQPLIIMFMVPLGISIAVSIRVGNELGAGNPKGAKRASYMAFACVGVIGGVYIALIQSTKNYIGLLFTKEEEVIEGVSDIMNVACFFMYSDVIQVTVAGILRGSGRQYVGAVINFICYYIIGLPVGIPLALKADLGARGLWIGLAAGNILQAILGVIVFFSTNWEKESQKAMKRALGSREEAMETKQSIARDSETPSSNEDDSQTELDSCCEAGAAEKDKTEAPDTTSLSSSTSSSTLDDLTMEQLEEIPLHPLKPSKPLEDHCNDVQVGNGEIKIDEEKTSDPVAVMTSSRKSCKSKTRLLLYRGAFFVLGLAIVVGGGVSSQYHPPIGSGNYTECSDVRSNNNESSTEHSGLLFDATYTIVHPTATHLPYQPTPTPAPDHGHSRTSRLIVDMLLQSTDKSVYTDQKHLGGEHAVYN